MGISVLQEAIDQLRAIPCARRVPEIVAQGIQTLARLGLRHDIQLASRGQEHLHAPEGFQMPREPAGGPADALGNGAQLPLLRCEERQNAVRFAEISSPQDDGFGGVDTRSAHVGLNERERASGAARPTRCTPTRLFRADHSRSARAPQVALSAHFSIPQARTTPAPDAPRTHLHD